MADDKGDEGELQGNSEFLPFQKADNDDDVPDTVEVVALDATLTSDGGWSLDLSEPVLARALCHVDNAYWLPDVRINGRVVRTHKTSQTAFRGFGGPQGMLDMTEYCNAVGAHPPNTGLGHA